MKKLLIATENKDKLREAQAILQVPLDMAHIDIDEPQSLDIEYVVKKKAEEAYKILKRPLIVDDVGFKIEAWNGFPGPFIKFLLQTLGNRKLLKLLKNETNRNVIVQGTVGYHDGKNIKIFTGEVEGTISYEERGSDGWGFDFFFVPKGEKKTFAELGFNKKNELSHRRAAFTQLKKFLDSKKNQKKI